MCVTWWQRRTAEGVPVFQHGGPWGGQNSDFFFVPDRGSPFTTLTNSTTGPKLIADLTRSGGGRSAISPGSTTRLPCRRSGRRHRLAAYEGRDKGWIIPPTGTPDIYRRAGHRSPASPTAGCASSATWSLSSPSTAMTSSSRPTPRVKAKRSHLVRGPDGALLVPATAGDIRRPGCESRIGAQGRYRHRCWIIQEAESALNAQADRGSSGGRRHRRSAGAPQGSAARARARWSAGLRVVGGVRHHHIGVRADLRRCGG